MEQHVDANRSREFLRMSGLHHTRTSVAYPQSNGKIDGATQVC